MLGTALAGIIYIAATQVIAGYPSFRYGLFRRAAPLSVPHDSGGCARWFPPLPLSPA